MIQQEISQNTVDAIRTVLGSLHARIPLKLWIVMAVADNHWSVVYQLNNGFHLPGEQVPAWQQLFCSLSAADQTPQFAAKVTEAATVITLPNGDTTAIKAYIGMPLYDDAGKLIGALCGIDPSPDVIGIRAGDALVRQTATLVGRLLAMEIQVAAQRMLALNWSDSSHRDPLTGLLNQRGWDEVMQSQLARSEMEIHGVILVEITAMPVTATKPKSANPPKPAKPPKPPKRTRDELVQHAANTLMLSVRGQDVLARLASDCFAILVRCDSAATVNAVVNRIKADLTRARAKPILGFATCPPADSVDGAFAAANADMLSRRSAR